MLLVVHAALATVSCRARVVGDLDEAEANRAVIALERAGIPAMKAREVHGRSVSWTVKVDAGEAAHAREILSSLSVPRPPSPGFDEIVGDDSIVPSASRERMKETIARGREIARTLESVEGVVQASVLLAPAEPPMPGQEPAAPGTASALIKVADKHRLSTEEVRRLVAGAVPGVEPEGVTVVLTPAGEPAIRRVEWVRLGPFVVKPSSRTPLAAVLAAMALTNVALAVWTVSGAVLRWRRRRSAIPAREPRSP
jgi:type III secretion system YscJ/HrcJ family lipoprotein